MEYVYVLIIASLCFYISRLDKKFEKKLAENREKLIAKYEAEYADKLKKNVEKSLDTSRRVLKGQIHEQLAPFLPGFPFESSDCSFLGKPVDLIVFNGLAAGEVTSIVLADIKTGAATLTKTQRQIRDCVAAGKVEFRKLSI